MTTSPSRRILSGTLAILGLALCQTSAADARQKPNILIIVADDMGFSDAGCYLKEHAANTPFRLHKSWNHEGGIATPLIVSWPAGIKARNELRTDPGHLIDMVPTILEITAGKQPATVAGLPVPPMQGMSLVPAFSNNGALKHEYLWWNHIGYRAVRVGAWKLVAAGKSPWELYDLAKDRSETKNLASANPEKVKELELVWTKGARDCLALAQQDPSSGLKKGKKKPETPKDEEE